MARGDNITRTNFGYFLQALIMNDIDHWADVCGYTGKDRTATDIRNEMRKRFNESRSKGQRQDHLAFAYCDNPDLFADMTGLNPLGANVSKAEIVKAQAITKGTKSPHEGRT